MANEGFYRLSLLDTHGKVATDAHVRVTFRREDGADIFRRNVDLSAPLQPIKLPAFPQVKALSGFLEPSRFRAREIPFFMLTHAETIERHLTVFRQPAKWRAMFDPWALIEGSAAQLVTVLTNSPDVQVKGWKTYPSLTGAAYDAFGADREREELPKATLLNVFSRLITTNNPTAGRPWFHRFQVVVWTVVLGIVFVRLVYGELAMPQFSGTLLGLMGLSSGTYIGFKFPEALK